MIECSLGWDVIRVAIAFFCFGIAFSMCIDGLFGK